MTQNEKIPKLTRPYTKVISKVLGSIELKAISGKDATFIYKLLREEKDDKEFTLRLLYNQLVKPKIKLDKFKGISDSELKVLLIEFVNDEYNLSDYYKETNDFELFKNFRIAVRRYLFSIQSSFNKSLGNIGGFTRNFSNIVRPIDLVSMIPKPINLAPVIPKIINSPPQWNVANLIGQNMNYSEVITKSLIGTSSLSAVAGQFQSSANILSKIMLPQINIWKRWTEANRILFNVYIERWEEFEKIHKIPREEAIGALKRYKWFMTPSLPTGFIFRAVMIGKRKGNQRGAMNRLFVDYFSEEDFINLEILVHFWKSKDIFKHRMKIFRDCVSVLKQSDSKTNPSNLIIPTLIAQIDGIQNEFMKMNGITMKKKGGLKDSNGQGIKWKDWYGNLTSDGELIDSAKDIFLNILFQEADKGKPLETPYTFSRHKIMHGENYRYGRIDNTIRAFLILDFLAALIKT